MSSMIAVKRPLQDGFPHQNEHPCVSSVAMHSVSVKTSPIELFTEEDLEKRLTTALRERDEQWLRHEKAQIHFLQNEGAQMLRALHVEIERLSNLLREINVEWDMDNDAQRKIDVSGNDEEAVEELTAIIKEQKNRIKNLEIQLASKETTLNEFQRKVSSTIEKMNETIKVQSDRIRQLSGELQDRTLTVTQLSGQLRQYRLREAMATAQQRRRASAQSPNGASPIVSPSSPHRIFPPQRSLVTAASVSVTYPGNPAKMKSANMDPTLAEDVSIEKQKNLLRRKSASQAGLGPSYKN